MDIRTYVYCRDACPCSLYVSPEPVYNYVARTHTVNVRGWVRCTVTCESRGHTYTFQVACTDRGRTCPCTLYVTCTLPLVYEVGRPGPCGTAALFGGRTHIDLPAAPSGVRRQVLRRPTRPRMGPEEGAAADPGFRPSTPRASRADRDKGEIVLRRAQRGRGRGRRGARAGPRAGEGPGRARPRRRAEPAVSRAARDARRRPRRPPWPKPPSPPPRVSGFSYAVAESLGPRRRRRAFILRRAPRPPRAPPPRPLAPRRAVPPPPPPPPSSGAGRAAAGGRAGRDEAPRKRRGRRALSPSEPGGAPTSMDGTRAGPGAESLPFERGAPAGAVAAGGEDDDCRGSTHEPGSGAGPERGSGRPRQGSKAWPGLSPARGLGRDDLRGGRA